MSTLEVILEYAIAILILLYGAVILVKIATDQIDISRILGEAGGGASMSRFQLLVFTLVIGLSFFVVVISKKAFPDVPNGVLVLLGISGTTFGVSKGIQAGGGLPSK
jgi:hypothetical protein